jgi:hypothetical protein
MNRRLFSFAVALTLVCLTAILALAQDQKSAWTVIEYPPDKEVVVDLTPTEAMPEAKGTARVTRSGEETTIQVEVSGLTGATTSYTLYAVDHTGKVTSLGTVSVSEGSGALDAKTSLHKFMLVLSPEADLTAINADTRVALRSAVPSGFEAVPQTGAGEAERAEAAEKPPAETAPPAYDAPMLRVADLKRGAEATVRVDFAGETQGLRANAFLKPRKDGTTQISLRFYNLKQAPSGARYVLWSVSPENNYERLGAVLTTGKRNDGRIEAKTSLPDFGLFLTTENEDTPSSPAGALLAKLVR